MKIIRRDVFMLEVLIIGVGLIGLYVVFLVGFRNLKVVVIELSVELGG